MNLNTNFVVLLNMKKMSSGFCMCCVPVVSDNGMMVGDEKSNKSSEVKPAMGSDEKQKSGGVGSFGRKNKHGRRSLTRYFKAVFFETSLIKKMRIKKLGQKLHRIYGGHKFRFKSKFKSESKSNKIIKSIINKTPREGIDESTRSNVSSKFSSFLSSNMTSNSSSTLSSSSLSLMMESGRSSSSSISSVSRPLVTKIVVNNVIQGKLEKGNRKGRHGFSIGVCCSLLISLLVLVIWGKVCAIFCTSIVLLFANRWIKSIKSRPISKNVVIDHRLSEIDSKLYKKEIIMKGFLERTRYRNLC